MIKGQADTVVKRGQTHTGEERGQENCQQRNANFPVLSSLTFMGPGAVLADSCFLTLPLSHSHSAVEEIHSPRGYRRDGTLFELWVAVASLELGPRVSRSLETETAT